MKIRQFVTDYADHIRAFRPNARYYLLSVVISGASMGVYRLLFNFYVLSQGYDEALLGNLITVSSLTALVVALPMGYAADWMGRKTAFILGYLAVSVSIFVMVGFPSAQMFITMNVLLGFGQSLSGVSMGPFLMENSGNKERTYLFSFSSGLQTASGFLGNWVGGLLPGWIGGMRLVSSTSTVAYGGALLVIATGAALAAVPLFFLRANELTSEQRSIFAPLSFFAKSPKLLGKLILPMLATSIGAGLVMPFMNVFFREIHHQPDPVIGSLFAWGSLAMGIGLLIAPPLADRYGKIQLVVITQGLSIPFLILLGFAPWFWVSSVAYFFRLSLMNMSGPVYQTFVMEHVDSSSRGTIASMVSMANNFGWAFSPTISGWLQVKYGFAPAFWGTILFYLISVVMYWRFFGEKSQRGLSGITRKYSRM